MNSESNSQQNFTNKISIDALVIAKFSRSIFKDMQKGQITVLTIKFDPRPRVCNRLH